MTTTIRRFSMGRRDTCWKGAWKIKIMTLLSRAFHLDARSARRAKFTRGGRERYCLGFVSHPEEIYQFLNPLPAEYHTDTQTSLRSHKSVPLRVIAPWYRPIKGTCRFGLRVRLNRVGRDRWRLREIQMDLTYVRTHVRKYGSTRGGHANKDQHFAAGSTTSPVVPGTGFMQSQTQTLGRARSHPKRERERDTHAHCNGYLTWPRAPRSFLECARARFPRGIQKPISRLPTALGAPGEGRLGDARVLHLRTSSKTGQHASRLRCWRASRLYTYMYACVSCLFLPDHRSPIGSAACASERASDRTSAGWLGVEFERAEWSGRKFGNCIKAAPRAVTARNCFKIAANSGWVDGRARLREQRTENFEQRERGRERRKRKERNAGRESRVILRPAEILISFAVRARGGQWNINRTHIGMTSAHRAVLVI